ncbi:MAG TPA: RagB/SusD family nutrient uptake outer membrane protein [Cytophagales bacterium]|nr:RagB/SusD family nutrient uptake outer membrane protein [Cytophagales bacterium]
MKKLKNIYSIYIKTFLILLLVTLGSCNDFLEKPLQGALTQETFPTTERDALLATNAVYNIMLRENYNYGLFPIIDIMSDDSRKGSNPGDAAATVGPFENFTHVATEETLSRWWSTLYEGVKRANVVIERVPSIQMNEQLKSRYIAEANFLRAVFYFDLVRAWGGVPKVTTTNTSRNLPRASQEEIYNLIEQDLLAAIQVLPQKTEYAAADVGRASKGAAKALLAKVYLYQKDFVNAEKYALEVINSGLYDLEPDFANANSKAGEHGQESVFEIGALGEESITRGGNQFGNVQGVRGAPNKGWGFNRPSIALMNSFEQGDPRLDKTVIYLGEVLDGITISGDTDTPNETRDANGNLIEIETYNQKVWTPGNDVPSAFGYNRRLIRYAEVLLIAAEALNENDKPEDALIYLNDVRERAREGNPAILPDRTETDKDVLRDLILHERRVELALEGQRFWDLVRTGKAPSVLGPLGFIEGKHELLPIPQSEMDLTQNIWEQNPQW